jgi:endo-1,4-beta-D-glucanase Y
VIRDKVEFKFLLPWVLVLTLLMLSFAGVIEDNTTFTTHSAFDLFHDGARRPFPQHVAYWPGSIKPKVEQHKMDEITETFYDAWKARYLKNDCGPDQYYVWFDSAHGGGNAAFNTISVSEGQGYGMIITAYMAGYDPEAKKYFDGLYAYYRDHISETAGSALMGWDQITGCEEAPDSESGDGDDSSTDADVDIAYALLLADRQWGSAGAVNYRAQAKRIIRDIMRYEVNPVTWTPKLGNWAWSYDPDYFDTRTSDFILAHFRAFQKVTGDRRWGFVIERCYRLIARMQKRFSPSTGLLPDFILKTNLLPVPAKRHFLESSYDGAYYENACRTPWRLATDYLINGDERAKKALGRINDWIMRTTEGDPERIKAGYYLNGKSLPGSDYPSAAFVAPLAVGAMVDASNQLWLDHLWTYLVRDDVFQIAPQMYYENTLKMLALIVLSGNWWAPTG